jgi:long-chain acyl-CoA synthetase
MTTGSLAALLERVVQAGRATLDGTGGRLDAAGIDAAGARTTAHLAACGIAPGEPVLTLMANRPADIATLLGVWRAGAVAVPVDAAAPPAVRLRLTEQVGARISIGPGGVEGGLADREPRSLEPGAALVIFTSGSTGKPKGVVIGHDRLAGKIAVLEKLLPMRCEDVVLVPLRLTFIFGLWVSFLALLAGARVVLMERFTVTGMSEALSGGATVAAVVPTMLRSLPVDVPPSAPLLRMVLTGGEPLGAALAGRVAAMYPRAGMFDLYGSTETGSCDFCLPVLEPSHRGSIGRPTAGVEYRIVGEHGRQVADGEQGELQIRTPFGMLGYLNAPELTAATFAGDYFRTGDLARLRGDGLVELVGRAKDIVSRGGIKIAPLELDHLFASHPDVEAALTGAVGDERLGEAVHVLIVPRKGARVDVRAMRDWAAERLERGKLPDGIHLVDELPVGGTGKADRSAVASVVTALRS